MLSRTNARVRAKADQQDGSVIDTDVRNAESVTVQVYHTEHFVYQRY